MNIVSIYRSHITLNVICEVNSLENIRSWSYFSHRLIYASIRLNSKCSSIYFWKIEMCFISSACNFFSLFTFLMWYIHMWSSISYYNSELLTYDIDFLSVSINITAMIDDRWSIMNLDLSSISLSWRLSHLIFHFVKFNQDLILKFLFSQSIDNHEFIGECSFNVDLHLIAWLHLSNFIHEAKSKSYDSTTCIGIFDLSKFKEHTNINISKRIVICEELCHISQKD